MSASARVGHSLRKRVRLAGAATLLTGWLALGVCAQSEPDPVREVVSTLPGRIEDAHLSVLGILVGEDSLDEVVAQLGPASRFTPKGSNAVVALCYASSGSGRDVAVLFLAQRADADSIVSLAHVAPRGALLGEARHCAPLPVPAQDLATQTGVALGMSRTELIRRFTAHPSEQSARALGFYYYEPFQVAAGSRERCQLLSGVRAQLDAHGVRSFLLYRLQSGAGC